MFVTHHVINNLKMHVTAFGPVRLGIIYFVSKTRLVCLFERQVALRGGNAHFLKAVGVRDGKPNPHALASGHVLDGEAIVERKMTN